MRRLVIMMWQRQAILALLFVIKIAQGVEKQGDEKPDSPRRPTGKSLARGFNDNIDWVTLEDGMRLIKEQKKPGMILIHKTWCGACKHLKPAVTQSKEMEALSRDFVMINLQDEEEPRDAKYKPDGGYIPRVLFVRSDGEIMHDIYNADGSDNYKYYYSSPDYIVKSMERVKKLHSTPVDEL